MEGGEALQCAGSLTASTGGTPGRWIPWWVFTHSGEDKDLDIYLSQVRVLTSTRIFLGMRYIFGRLGRYTICISCLPLMSSLNLSCLFILSCSPHLDNTLMRTRHRSSVVGEAERPNGAQGQNRTGTKGRSEDPTCKLLRAMAPSSE